MAPALPLKPPAIGTISNITNLSQQHLGVAPDQFGNAVLGLLKAVVDQLITETAEGVV